MSDTITVRLFGEDREFVLEHSQNFGDEYGFAIYAWELDGHRFALTHHYGPGWCSDVEGWIAAFSPTKSHNLPEPGAAAAALETKLKPLAMALLPLTGFSIPNPYAPTAEDEIRRVECPRCGAGVGQRCSDGWGGISEGVCMARSRSAK